MKKQYKKQQEMQAHPLLAQLLVRPVGRSGTMCVNPTHAHVEATWEIRFYADTTRILSLVQSGVSRDEANQILWDEMCAEQDTNGVVMHSSMGCCQDCTVAIVEGHIGEAAARVAISTALYRATAMLLVADRVTEDAMVLNGLPLDSREKDIAALLKKKYPKYHKE